MLNLIPRFINERYEERAAVGELDAAVMFIDIVGFTGMTEDLMRHGKEGAEVLSDTINRTFGPVINRVYKDNGFIALFAGDAFMTIFPENIDITRSDGYHSEAGANAFNSARAIQKRFSIRGGVHQTRFGEFQMSVKIGLSYGGVSWGIPGGFASPGYVSDTYYFKGNPVNRSAEMLKSCAPGDIVICEELQKALRDEHGSIILKPSRIQKPKPLTRVKKTILRNFVPEGLTVGAITGEFRDVVSVFVSFRNIEGAVETDEFISAILMDAARLGGYFNGLFFDDKGPHLLVLFGAPVSYETNVNRAADFALSVKSQYGDGIRIGATYGTVYAGLVGGKKRATYTAMGDSVNTAARFMEGADWGSLRFSEEAARVIKTGYDIDAVSSLTFKGKAEPVPVYELTGRKEVVSRLFEGEVLGRDAESAKLRKFAEPIYDNKFGGVVYIYGDAGIGKSHLVYNFADEAAPRVRTFFLPADSIIRKSFNPFVYALKNYFQQSEAMSEGANKAAFEKVYDGLISQLRATDIRKVTEATVDELVRTKSVLGALVGLYWADSLYEQLDAKGKYENTLFAIKEFFKAQSLIQPTLLILEDFQWTDEASRETIRTLTRNIPNFPILLLALSRYNDDGGKPVARFDKSVPVAEIALGTLAGGIAGDLISDKMGCPPEEELVSFIDERTEGNPFYVEQFCQYLKENELAELRDGKYYLVQTDFKVPQGIKAVLIARIDRLTRELKELVQTASVLGREFEVGILGRMLKGTEINPLLSQGESGGIWTAVSELLYIFKHGLMQDAAYEMQLKKRLRELHRLAAEVIEKVYENAEVRYADLAFHYEKAEDIVKAKDYLEKAASYAKDEFKNDEAIELYDRLLNYVSGRDEECTVIMNKGSVLELTGKWGEAEELYGDVLTWAEANKKRALIAEVKNKMGNILRNKGRFPDAIAMYQDAYEISTEIKDERDISESLGGLGIIHAIIGKLDESLKYLEEQLAIAERADDKRAMCMAMGNISLVYNRRGEMDKAMQVSLDTLGAAELSGDKQSLARATGNLGNLYLMKNDLDKAMECQQQVLAIFQELGDKQGFGRAINNVGGVYEKQGKLDKALTCFELHLQNAEELGEKREISAAMGNIGNVYKQQGNYKSAMEYFKNVLTIVEELGDKLFICYTLGYIGEVHLLKEEFSEAVDYLNKSLEIAEVIGNKERIGWAKGKLDEMKARDN